MKNRSVTNHHEDGSLSSLILAVIIIFSFIFLATHDAKADESYNTLILPIGSYHQEKAFRNEANQNNPGIGLRHTFDKKNVSYLDNEIYLQGVYMFRNSTRGRALSLSVGYEMDLWKSSNGFNVKCGVEIGFIKYEDGRDNVVYNRVVPALTLAISHQKFTNTKLNIYTVPLPGKSVVLAGLSVRF